KILIRLVSEPAEIHNSICRHSLAYAGCDERDACIERTDLGQPRQHQFVQIVYREVVLCGDQDAFLGCSRPNLQEQVDERVGARISVAPMYKRLDLLEEAVTLVSLAAEEVDTLFE